jgi:membrane fusion protein (multidrug efflux system)
VNNASPNPPHPPSSAEGHVPQKRTNGVTAFFRHRPQATRVLLALAAAAVVVGVLAWYRFQGRVSTDDAQIDAHILPVAARVGGTVLAVEVEENRRVEAGTVLVRLDRTDFEVALSRAEADRAAAEAALAAARSGVPITSASSGGRLDSAAAEVRRSEAAIAAADAELAAARARAREAEANAVKANRDRDRLEELVAKDEVSRQQYDAAVAAAIAADATVEAARAAVRKAEEAQRQALDHVTQTEADLRSARTAPQQVEVTKAQVALAEARLQQAAAAVEQARLALEYTVVKAAVTGVVSKRSVEPGQVVQPGQPLFALVDLDDVWVTANFKETKLTNMQPGQEARITVDAYGRTLKGHVDSIGPATGARFSLLPPENASGNYVKVVQRVPVKIVFEPGQDPDHKLRPGLSVVPTVYTR